MPFKKDNPFAQLAKERARTRLMQRFTFAGIAILFSGIFIGYLLFEPTKHPVSKMPKHGEFVIAVKWNSWYKSYADENGEFRNAEDGTPLGTVIYWTRP